LKPKSFYTLPFILFFVSACFISCAQDSAKHFSFYFGDSVVIISKTSHQKNRPFQLIQLHHNETTADEVAKKFSEDFGIDYLQILNNEKRLIDFTADAKTYLFDPNRIFSSQGIAATLEKHSQYSDDVLLLIDSFSKILLSHFDSSKTIVAMHNNMDEGFGLGDYINNETGLIHNNPNYDADDFFITTDSTIYEKLKERNFNVVWEWSEKLKDDGSLSIYCNRKKIAYVNIEAEHGHAKEQAAMLEALMEILKEKTK
jgi:hypothetical protein